MKYPHTIFAMALLLAAVASAQPGRGPTQVNVSPAKAGQLSPTNQFKGTVEFKEVSEVASEESGKIETVNFEEGDEIPEGTTLITLDTELLEAELAVARARAKQTEANLTNERIRLERARTLAEDDVTTEQELDDIFYRVEGLQHQLAGDRASIQRLEEQLTRKVVKAPFDGVVLERRVELGEWASPGRVIAVLARRNTYDVMVNIPEDHVEWVSPGSSIDLVITGREVQGHVDTVIPRGDVATRTFPVKVRVTEVPWLLEGMSARVDMPVGAETQCLLVPRDAVLLEGNQHYIFYVEDKTAKRLDIDVIGFDGLQAGFKSDVISDGANVIVKGHERVRPESEVEIVDRITERFKNGGGGVDE